MNNFYALEAFLHFYRGKDVFKEMKESGSSLLQPFLGWEERIDFRAKMYWVHTDKLNPATLDYILGWIVELWKEKKERLNLTKCEKRLYEFVCARSGNATRLWLNIPTDNISVSRYYVLQQASYNGHADVVKALLEDGRVYPGDDDNNALRQASGNGHVDVVALLLADPRVDPTAHTNESIRKAAEFGHADVVRLLLADKRVDPSARNNIAIQDAALKGHFEIVKLLLADPRVDPYVADGYVLLKARYYGYIDIVHQLLKLSCYTTK